MADMIATRDAYGKALLEFSDKYDFIVLDADLAEATKTVHMKKNKPDRFFDCGIAEGNMMSVAAGIASTGQLVFASSFAMFAAGRAYEQVRNSIGYPHLNVKIGATHAGITVGEDGATHQCNEDIALMRTIPGMVVLNPADGVSARAAVEAAILHKGPVYMRFGRAPMPIIYGDDYKFEIGKGKVLADGKDVTIVATGITVSMALQAREALKAEGIDAAVIDIATIKPIDEELLIEYAKKTGKIVTCEEHSIIGGLGGAVSEVLSEKCPTKIKRVGIKDTYGSSGKALEVAAYYGISAEHIAAAVKEIM
jgi:transketolase